MAPGESLEQGDLLDHLAHLVSLDHRDHMEMLATLDIWGHRVKGDQRAHRGNRVKTENRANQETLERLGSPDQWAPEVSPALLGHLD